MPYTVSFLDSKLYQSLSFDSDIKFPESCDFVKKFWILKEYKKQGADVTISESEDQKEDSKSHSSYEIQKRFQGDELIVEIVQSLKFSDNFDFFAKAEFDLPTGDIELDEILGGIKESDFNESIIKSSILDSVLQGNYPENPEDDPKQASQEGEDSSEEKLSE